MQGRLMGKRVDGEYFMESAAHGEPVEGCNYLLAVDMDMDPVPGYAIANWESGYGDFDMVPDFNTLRRIPWLPGAALGLTELAEGEAWPGPEEINFHFSDALTMADNHVIYKNGIKELANQHGCSVSFMAKPDHRWIGRSCPLPRR